MHLRRLQKSQWVRQHSEGAFTCSLYLELELVPLHSVFGFFFFSTGMMSSSVKTASVQLKATKVLSERELHFGAQKWDHGRRSVTLCIKVWRHQRKRNLSPVSFACLQTWTSVQNTRSAKTSEYTLFSSLMMPNDEKLGILHLPFYPFIKSQIFREKQIKFSSDQSET